MTKIHVLPHGEDEENYLKKNNRLRSINENKGTMTRALKNLLLID